MNTYGYDVAHCVYDLAIDANIRRREKLDKDVLSKVQDSALFLREYCTLHINLGRRTGKTEYIIDKFGPDDIVLVSNERMSHEIRNKLKNKFISPYRCKTVHNFEYSLDSLKGLKVDTIWVDEPMLCFNNYNFDDFLYTALSLRTKNIFMFGE